LQFPVRRGKLWGMSLSPHSTPRPQSGKKLRPAHARHLRSTIAPMLGFLGRLRTRMVAVGFVESDALMQLVQATHDALHRLAVELHYEGCEPEKPP